MSELSSYFTDVSRPTYQKVFLFLAQLSVVGYATAVPLSHTLTGAFTVSVLLFMALARQSNNCKHLAFYNPINLALLFFGAYVLIAAIYSHVDLIYILKNMKKYERLLLISFLVFFLQSKQLRTMALTGFIASMVVTLIISYYQFFFTLTTEPNLIFFNRIETSFLFAFTAFLLAHIALRYPRWRSICLVLVCLFIVNLLHMNSSRTGFISSFILAILYAWQIRQRRTLSLAICATLAILGFSLIMANLFPNTAFSQHTSVLFNSRASTTAISASQRPSRSNTDPAINYRLLFIKHYPALIRQAPILGHGLGSSYGDFSHYQLPDIKPLSWGNPHNYYLQTLYELGVIGLALFFIVVLLIWRARLAMPTFERYLVEGLLLSMLIGSGCDNLFYLSSTGHFFIFFVSYCLVEPYQLRIKPTRHE